jgi:hypothetical protein
MLMTKAAYARHKGVSRQTVYNQIKKRACAVGAKIDVSATEQKQQTPIFRQRGSTIAGWSTSH